MKNEYQIPRVKVVELGTDAAVMQVVTGSIDDTGEG